MSKQFKPGDKVRNLDIDNTYFGIHIGDVLTVKDLTDDGRLIRLVGKGGGWYPSSFALVEAIPPARAFKAGDKVRIVRKVAEEVGWKNSWVSPMDDHVGRPDILTVNRVTAAGVYFEDYAGEGLGWPPSSLELVASAAPAAPAGTLKYADLKPGDVIKVTRELTVVSHSLTGTLNCRRPDGSPIWLHRDAEPHFTIELVARKPTPLAVGDTVRCALSGKVGTLTGTSEDRKYAWVVFGSGLRPKTRLMSELSAA